MPTSYYFIYKNDFMIINFIKNNQHYPIIFIVIHYTIVKDVKIMKLILYIFSIYNKLSKIMLYKSIIVILIVSKT